MLMHIGGRLFRHSLIQPSDFLNASLNKPLVVIWPNLRTEFLLGSPNTLFRRKAFKLNFCLIGKAADLGFGLLAEVCDLGSGHFTQAFSFSFGFIFGFL